MLIKLKTFFKTTGLILSVILLFLVPIKFGLSVSNQTKIIIEAPDSLIKLFFANYPNFLGQYLMAAIAFCAFVNLIFFLFKIKTALKRGRDFGYINKKLIPSLVGWLLFAAAIIFSDFILPGSRKFNNVNFQFLLYGAWFFSVLIFFKSKNSRIIAVLFIVAAGALVCKEAVSQHLGGLEYMRQKVYTDAGFKSFTDYTNFTLAVNNDVHTRLFIQKLTSARVFGTFIYPNALGGFIIILLPLCVGLFKSINIRFAKIFAAAVFCLGLVAILFSKSKASIFLSALGLMTLLWLAYRAKQISKRILLSVCILSGIIVIGMLFWGYGHGLSKKFKSTGGARIDYWTAAAKMIRENPWIGRGTDGFGKNYLSYKRPGAEDTQLPHNFLLNIWVDYGIIGVAGIILALVFPLAVSWKYYLKNKNAFDWLSVSCLVAGSGFILHCLVDFDFHTMGIVVPAIFAIVVSCKVKQGCLLHNI